MPELKKLSLTTALLLIACIPVAQTIGHYHAIYSGIPWFDNNGNVVSAHGECIIKDKNRYYLFGERQSDTSNAFSGFNCYSSNDLYNWKFESIALPIQPTGKLGPNRRGERPKVMKCPRTDEYVMYMHVDNLGHTDQFVGYATSNTIAGPYTFHGPLLFNGNSIRKWDMGTFQDKDGSGYVLLHGGDIYKLSDDYKSIVQQVNKDMTAGFESPAIFRKDNLYYFLGSNLTSWERNDNYYFTASSLKGPWIRRGLFAPKGTLTWNSQTTFVFPIEGSKDTTFMFMGDRWSFPKQRSAATYVWQSIKIEGASISIPHFLEAWKINTSTGIASTAKVDGETIGNNDKKSIVYSGKWKSDTGSMMSSNVKNSSFTVKFKGTQVGFYGLSRPDGGYAQVVIRNDSGKTVLHSIVGMYYKYPVQSLRFLSPTLKKDNYTFTVTVMGEHGNWSDKKKNIYGSTGNFVSLDKIVMKK